MKNVLLLTSSLAGIVVGFILIGGGGMVSSGVHSQSRPGLGFVIALAGCELVLLIYILNRKYALEKTTRILCYLVFGWAAIGLFVGLYQVATGIEEKGEALMRFGIGAVALLNIMLVTRLSRITRNGIS